MSGFSLSDRAVIIGGISLFLYFVFSPLINEVIPNADSLGLQIWFLVAGIVAIAVGITSKAARSVLSR